MEKKIEKNIPNLQPGDKFIRPILSVHNLSLSTLFITQDQFLNLIHICIILNYA